MKAFAQLFTGSTGLEYVSHSMPAKFITVPIKPVELLGSDGVYILDARNNISRMIDDCKAHIERMKGLNKGIVGFAIHRGDLRRSRVIYTNIK